MAWIEAEEGDGHQVADEEVGVEEGECEGHEEDNDEDVQHTLLRVLGTDLYDFLAVLDGCLFFVELDVFLDEDNGPVGARCNGLCRCAGEPVDNGATHEKTEDDLGLDEAQLRDNVPDTCFQAG